MTTLRLYNRNLVKTLLKNWELIFTLQLSTEYKWDCLLLFLAEPKHLDCDRSDNTRAATSLVNVRALLLSERYYAPFYFDYAAASEQLAIFWSSRIGSLKRPKYVEAFFFI